MSTNHVYVEIILFNVCLFIVINCKCFSLVDPRYCYYWIVEKIVMWSKKYDDDDRDDDDNDNVINGSLFQSLTECIDTQHASHAGHTDDMPSTARKMLNID